MLTRRSAMLIPLLVAGCVSEAPPPLIPRNFAPLDFSYLTPLRLNVASIQIQQAYVPPGVPPDVSQDDPINPVAALKQMATERLRAVGTAGTAVFTINNASIIQEDGTLTGAFSVTLTILTAAGVPVGYAQATATRQIAGFGNDLPGALDSLTRTLMEQMNVEFEYQVRRSLGRWLVAANARPAPVQQAPLEAAPLPAPPTPPPPPPPTTPPAAAPGPPGNPPALPPLGPVIE